MISKLSTRLVACLIRHQTIDEADRELYVYGFFILLSNLYYFLLALFSGILLGIGLESLLFFISYLCIRQFAGGHHAKTEQRCMVFSTISILFCIGCVRLSAPYDLRIFYSLVFLFGAVMVLSFAPLDTPEKRLSVKEKQKYRKISLAVSAVLAVLFTVGCIAARSALYAPVGAAMGFEGVLLAYGKAAQAAN